MSLREMIAWLALAALAAIGLIVACNDPNAAGAQRSSAPLVYICQQWPCYQNGLASEHVLDTYDQFGNPLTTTSPYTWVTSYGLAYSITPLGDTNNPRMMIGWESPITLIGTLDARARGHAGVPFPASCKPPAWWIAPTDNGSALGLWKCSAAGAWVKDKNIS